jgi:hypothetical protein
MPDAVIGGGRAMGAARRMLHRVRFDGGAGQNRTRLKLKAALSSTVSEEG